MKKINFWITYFVMWILWLAITPKTTAYVVPEPLIVPVFIAIGKILPCMLEYAEQIAYSLIRAP